MEWFIQINEDSFVIGSVSSGVKAPVHPRQFGPYKERPDADNKRIKQEVIDRVMNNDKTVYAMKPEDIFEQNTLEN